MAGTAGSGSQVPSGMLIERDVEVPMPDGLILRADVFRPDDGGAVPVILTMGPYGKGLPYREAHFAPMWRWLISNHPEVLDGSSGEFMTWETVDPERWVPAGYAVVRVDSRGAGRSPGIMDILSPQETRDLYECIEWAGTQPWSSGKVGLCGISYYAMNQWWVAGLQPPHLAAMIPWEGASDYFREISRHGGILSNEFFDGTTSRPAYDPALAELACWRPTGRWSRLILVAEASTAPQGTHRAGAGARYAAE